MRPATADMPRPTPSTQAIPVAEAIRLINADPPQEGWELCTVGDVCPFTHQPHNHPPAGWRYSAPAEARDATEPRWPSRDELAKALDRLTREHLPNEATSWGEWSSTERFAHAILAALREGGERP